MKSTGEVLGLADTLDAVSYTHLDVYKRQAVYASPAPYTIKSCAQRFGNKYAGYDTCGRRERGVTVSYTHLDVYKRQH